MNDLLAINRKDPATVTVTIPKEELKFWTPDGWVLDEGYTVYVGADSRSAATV
jgi:hypothetical protein